MRLTGLLHRFPGLKSGEHSLWRHARGSTSLFAALCALVLSLPAAAQAPIPNQAPASTRAPVIAGPPDVLVLVISEPSGADRVDVTYAFTVPRAQALKDLAALRQASGWAVAGPRISSADAPTASRVGPMTSISFQAPGVVQSGQTLPVEPFVRAFHAYKRINLVFFAGPDFQFQGSRGYADNNVKFAVSQSGSTYTYQVQLLNPQVGSLHLQAAQPAAHRRSPWKLLLGILGIAAAAGIVTYLVALRLAAAPKREPEQTEIEQTETEKAEIRG